MTDRVRLAEVEASGTERERSMAVALRQARQALLDVALSADDAHNTAKGTFQTIDAIDAFVDFRR